MKKFIIIYLLFLTGISSYAQTVGSISGTVKDKNTQEELIGVAIKFSGEETFVIVTDENGAFSLKIPVGKYNLEIGRAHV